MSTALAHTLKGNLTVSSVYGSNSIQTDNDGNLYVGGTLSGGYSMMFRNRIINGNMIVDQRNAGVASAAILATATYTLDRWFGKAVGGGAIKMRQLDLPSSLAGFSKCMQITVSTADAAIAATDYAYVSQSIEGYNLMDMSFGSSDASDFTLSFWLQSTMTGTMGVRFVNVSGNRFLVQTITITSANTWQYFTVTVKGDTTGTWAVDNTTGITVVFCLMAGTTLQTATPNTWSATNTLSTSAQTNFLSSLTNIVYITGVQLEKGKLATPFEFRPYPVELQMCMRYLNMLKHSGSSTYFGADGHYNTTTQFNLSFRPIVTMRDAPGIKISALNLFDIEPYDQPPSAITIGNATTDSITIQVTDPVARTVGYCGTLLLDTAGAFIAFDAEL